MLLEGRGLTVRRGGRDLIAKIDIALTPGRTTIVVGPNGAGKSTLMRVLCGELTPDAGEITIAGSRLSALPAWRLACLRAVMPQGASLAFPFTVREVASFGAEMLGRGLDRRAREAITEDALVRADVVHLAERLYQTLSGGERQRVHFARVLAQIAAGRTVEERQILFLDEPIASLDLHHQLALLETARTLSRQGLAIFAVLHDLQLAAAFADELVMLGDGIVVAQGGPADVLSPERLRQIFRIGLSAPSLPPSPWLALSDAD